MVAIDCSRDEFKDFLIHPDFWQDVRHAMRSCEIYKGFYSDGRNLSMEPSAHSFMLQTNLGVQDQQGSGNRGPT